MPAGLEWRKAAVKRTEIEMTWRFLLVVMGLALAAAGVARGQDADPAESVVWKKVHASVFGNAPLEAIVMHLLGMGYFRDQQPDFTALNDLVDLYAAMGEAIPAKYPLYGRDAPISARA